MLTPRCLVAECHNPLWVSPRDWLLWLAECFTTVQLEGVGDGKAANTMDRGTTTREERVFCPRQFLISNARRTWEVGLRSDLGFTVNARVGRGYPTF